jgi:hypothetical protein
MLSLFFSSSLMGQGKKYFFDEKGISRQVLENYLDRSITMVYLLTPDKPEGRRVYSYHADDMRMIKNIGAKFIGRAIYCWGNENVLNNGVYWSTAKTMASELHTSDPDLILQGCLFEIVTENVNQVEIPGWVFTDYGLPVESRNFSYVSMLNKEGRLVNHWHKGSSVPDISQLETQLWFYYLACSYINIGCEALHLGQIELIGMNDPERNFWAYVISKIRAYASDHARRHWVLLDAHTPYGGMLKDGVSLLDFNSFPLRIKEIPDQPYKSELAINHLDALYKKSKGCISPSKWKCKHLPYLVEFDNYGRGKVPNVADLTSHYVWGWDEISWLSLQSENYRNEWLEYAYHWIHRTDPNGHLEMPGCRMITCPNESEGNYHANTKSKDCPIGYSQEATIKRLWEK